MLADLWIRVLGVKRAGIYDNFFDLGGHSLLATRVISGVRKALNVEMPLRSLFEAPTIVEFAKRVEEERRANRAGRIPPIERVTDRSNLPLSFSQKRLWFLDRLEGGSSSTTYPLP